MPQAKEPPVAEAVSEPSCPRRRERAKSPCPAATSHRTSTTTKSPLHPSHNRKAPDVSAPALCGIPVRHLATALTASASALALTACGVIDGVGGSDSSASPKKGDDITVGLLLPDRDTARFENFDHPVITKEVAALTNGKGKVVYANADASQDKQSAQFQQMVDQKVDVILVDALDSKAIAPDVRKAKDSRHPRHRLRPARRGPDRRVRLARQRTRRRDPGPRHHRGARQQGGIQQDRHDERRPRGHQLREVQERRHRRTEEPGRHSQGIRHLEMVMRRSPRRT